MARHIVAYLEERVSPREDPRSVGKALLGKKYTEQWRYRVGDYRIIAEIKDETVTILVVEIGHRREVYR
jgi:mRNA interferase RelE/StbE